MALDLNPIEKQVSDLLARAADPGSPEEEARTSAVIAARRIAKNKLAVINLEEYDQSWKDRIAELEKQLDLAKLRQPAGSQEIDGLRKQLAAYQQELDKNRQELDKKRKELDKSLQDLELQRKGERELKNAVAALESQRAQEAARASKLDTRASQLEKDLMTCRSTVDDLKARPVSVAAPDLEPLEKKVQELTLKAMTAQAAERACQSQRESELTYYEKKREAPPSNDARNLLIAGFLVGGFATLAAAFGLRSLRSTLESDHPAGRRAQGPSGVTVNVGGEDRFLPEGTLLQGTGPKVWIIRGGKRSWIRDPATFNAMHLQSNDVRGIDQTELETIPEGPSIHT